MKELCGPHETNQLNFPTIHEKKKKNTQTQLIILKKKS